MKKRNRLPEFPHQFFYRIGLRFRRFLLKLTGRLVPASMAVYEKAQGFWISRAIETACELNLADHLAAGPKSVTELARLSQTDEAALYRIMRALAGEGIFKELQGRIFINTRLSNALKEGPDSMKYMIMHQFGTTNMTLFTEMAECIRTGEGAAGKMLGSDAFGYLKEHPEINEVYNKAMDNTSGLMALALLAAYNFKGIRTIVDVGGGRGFLLAHLLCEYNDMRGILFDQPHVVDSAHRTIEEFGLQGRLEIIAGDFNDDIPAGADAYFMKNILHAFGDEACIKLLKKINEAMAPGGRLIILETVIIADNKPSFGKLIDLLMMAGTDGGKERTREEFEYLINNSGFKLKRIIPTITPFSILESEKN